MRSTRRPPTAAASSWTQAFEAAAKAFVDWRSDEDARRAALTEAANAMFAAGERIGPVLTAEQGKPLAAAGVEALAAGFWLKYFADLETPREVIQDDAAAYAEVVRRPHGGRRRHHPVELPDRARLVEDRPGPAGRQHDGPQAVALHAPQHPRSWARS